MGKQSFSFRRTSRRRRTKSTGESPLLPAPTASLSPIDAAISVSVVAASSKPKKKAVGARLWMRFDRSGQSELFECDLRILGPVFSQSSNILAREKDMVVNLKFIKAIVTAKEVILFDPLRQEVLPFVDQLRRQLPHKQF